MKKIEKTKKQDSLLESFNKLSKGQSLKIKAGIGIANARNPKEEITGGQVTAYQDLEGKWQTDNDGVDQR
jgi:GTP cyclohydrolase III